MDNWYRALSQTTNALLNQPDTSTEYWITVIAAIVAMAWVVGRVGNMLEVPNLGAVSTWVALAVGLAIMLAALTAGQIYLPQYFAKVSPVQGLIIGSLIASLVLVVPALMVYLRSKYVSTLISWLIGLAAGFALVVVVDTAFDAMESGGKSYERGKSHNAEVDKLIK